jgi:cyclophilin family peptidyl-prolyl cis-trans isomerase
MTVSCLLSASVVALFSFTAAAPVPAAQPPAKEPPAKAPAPAPAPPAKAPPTQAEKLVFVQMSTSMGDIVLELNQEKAPISVKNFLSYVDKKAYDGTIFHRVISSFMIQGGGYTPDLKEQKSDAPIKNEWQNGLKNDRATIAMARESAPDTATREFFINVKPNPALDAARPETGNAGYAVFGRVIAGMDVVDKIKAVKTGMRNGMADVPVETVTITKVVRITADEAAKAQKAAPPAPNAPEPPKPEEKKK